VQPSCWLWVGGRLLGGRPVWSGLLHCVVTYSIPGPTPAPSATGIGRRDHPSGPLASWLHVDWKYKVRFCFRYHQAPSVLLLHNAVLIGVAEQWGITPCLYVRYIQQPPYWHPKLYHIHIYVCSDSLRAGRSGDRISGWGDILCTCPGRRWGRPSSVTAGWQCNAETCRRYLT
jgi:hypothetical protein